MLASIAANVLLIVITAVTIVWGLKVRHRIDRVARDFKPTVPPPELEPKRPGETRISRINFQRSTGVRRPVRDYTIDEDGNDPLRGMPE